MMLFGDLDANIGYISNQFLWDLMSFIHLKNKPWSDRRQSVCKLKEKMIKE